MRSPGVVSTVARSVAISSLLVVIAAACGPSDSPFPVEPDLPPDASVSAVERMGADGAPRIAAERIQAFLAEPGDGPARIALAPGHYWLEPDRYIDPTCGNCQDPYRPVEAMAGLVVSGQATELYGTGETAGETIVHTGAGYGLVFDGCSGCVLRGLTVTDGVRDTVGEATSAAVLVRDGDVHLDDVVIRDNLGDSAVVAQTVAGIIGVAVREGGNLRLTRSRIVRNSWDGVAMYRDARGTLLDNVIDGVDKASGARLGGGRGVGIGLTWNARATVEGNLVTRYWKGIGVFVDAEAEIRENIVEDVLTWGIVLWDADQGTPRAVIERNAVHETGACGINVHDTGDSAGDPGALRDNLVVRTGQNPRYDSGEPYCAQTAIARPAVPPGFEIAGNLLMENREPDDAAGRDDMDAEAFDEAAVPLLEALRERPALAASTFLGRPRAGSR